MRAAAYEVTFDAPSPLRELAEQYSDLSRNKNRADISLDEWKRLVAAEPDALRDLFAVEGYFSPAIEIIWVSDSAVRMRVTPGPRAKIADVSFAFQGDLATSDRGKARAKEIEAQWTLRAGEPFRQVDWDAAKAKTLLGLRSVSYPVAYYVETQARVNAEDGEVSLRVEINSGEEVRYGKIEVQGLKELPRSIVDQISNIAPGEVHSAERLTILHERLVATGLFDAVSVEVDPSQAAPGQPAPIRVVVAERHLQGIQLGVGYSTVSGPRATIEHTHRRIFGFDWQATTTLRVARDDIRLASDWLSYPREGNVRHLASVLVAREEFGGLTVERALLRGGLRRDSETISRMWTLSALRDTVPTNTALSGSALMASFDWRRLAVDNPIFPTDGSAISLQSGIGVRIGDRSAGDVFGRTLLRYSLWRPLSDAWFAQARVEAGALIARDFQGIPQTLLFRAGGVNSVRGYGYQTLGVPGDNYVSGGRFMVTASAEVARQIVPNWYGAAFVDVGDASAGPAQWRENIGYGIGARWRSPVGPIRFDVAYGQAIRKFRLEVAVGAAF